MLYYALFCYNNMGYLRLIYSLATNNCIVYPLHPLPENNLIVSASTGGWSLGGQKYGCRCNEEKSFPTRLVAYWLFFSCSPIDPQAGAGQCGATPTNGKVPGKPPKNGFSTFLIPF
jgi:hypothetical protein